MKRTTHPSQRIFGDALKHDQKHLSMQSSPEEHWLVPLHLATGCSSCLGDLHISAMALADSPLQSQRNPEIWYPSLGSEHNAWEVAASCQPWPAALTRPSVLSRRFESSGGQDAQ